MPIDLGSADVIVPPEAPVGPPAAIPSVDLADATSVSPPEAPVRLPGIAKAGVTLVKWVLIIISVFVLISVVWIWTSEASFSRQIHCLVGPDVTLTKEVADSLVHARSEFRDFWLKIFQMVLLNVLLPVLTALLGYVFGRDQGKSDH
jgi:hypothetical protein